MPKALDPREVIDRLHEPRKGWGTGLACIQYSVHASKKKRTSRRVDFTVSADYRIKMKEREKRGKYQDFAKELKNLSILKVTVRPNVIGALCTFVKGFIHRLKDLETIQTTALLRWTRILRWVLKTWGDCCHTNSSMKLSANAGVKNLQKCKI